jgi:hypothetical protein
MSEQLAFQDPVQRYPVISPPEQDQQEPGLDAQLQPHADHGEDSYRGTGRLEGRKALVTGADSGIGAAVALAFAREGADVAMSYLPSEEPDASRIAGPDILVNNAGKQIFCEKLEDLGDDQFDETLKTNVYAMFWIIKAALPHLPAGSSIINTTSIEAYQPAPILIDYATTKAALTTFTQGLAQQLAPRGIRVNAAAPGPIWTPLQVSEGQPTEALPKFGQSTPLGRAGQPTELAPAYVFFASPESSYVLGETLNVNGGKPSP